MENSSDMFIWDYDQKKTLFFFFFFPKSKSDFSKRNEGKDKIKRQNIVFFLTYLKIIIQFLKVILYLQLLQIIGCIPHVAQYLLVSFLAQDSLYLPVHYLCVHPSLVTTSILSICESAYFLIYSLVCCSF